MLKCVFSEGKEELEQMFSSMVNINGKKTAWVCKNCQSKLKNNKMPPKSHKNSLDIVEVPELVDLSQFENMLIATELPFMFITKLPVSRMDAVRGKLTLVPIQEEDVRATVQAGQALPRTPGEAGLVTYELKKKLEYTSTVGRPQLARPEAMTSALKILKEAGNPHYQVAYDTPTEYKNRCQDDGRSVEAVLPELTDEPEDEQTEIQEENGAQSGEQEEETRYNDADDPVRRNQLAPGEGHTCMIQNNPEMERRSEDSVVSVAPGEGRRPEGLLYAKNFDTKAFPRLHNPDGSNGLHQDRAVKITDQQYFLQRLINCNRKWARDFAYLCLVTLFQEMKVIRGNMNMSYTTGRKIEKEGGSVTIEHHDAWSVLRSVPNSPKYWRDKKRETIAMMDNFGPFHWFFTLSCADKRWEPCIAAICRRFPGVKDIIYYSNPHKIIVKLEDKEVTLEDFIETIDQSKQDLLRENVQEVTRYFDKKVKSFMKNIVMVENNSLGVILYTYRIEFQKRGHPHAHGCLWIDINKMDKEFPGLKAAFQSLRHNRKLQEATVSTPLLERLPSSLKQTNALVNWIDKYTTCSLNKAKVGEVAAQRARELQTHGHTATCHKKSPECRCVCVPVLSQCKHI